MALKEYPGSSQFNPPPSASTSLPLTFLEDMNRKDFQLVRCTPSLFIKINPLSLIFLLFWLWGNSDAIVISLRLSSHYILRHMTSPFLAT